MRTRKKLPVFFSASLSLAVSALVMIPGLAQAQAYSDVGTILQNFNANELLTIPGFATAICYVVAVVMTAIAIVRLKQHVDAPHNTPLSKPMLMMTGAGLFFSLPAVASMLITTLGFSTDQTGILSTVSNSAGAVTPAAQVTLDQMLESFVGNIYGPAITTADVVAFVLGVILMCQGVMSLSQYGSDPRTHSGKNISTKFVIAAFLMSMPQALSMVGTSLFGSSGTSLVTAGTALAYNPAAASSAAAAAVNNSLDSVLQFVQIIGFIGFVRGWLILRSAIEGTGQASQGTAFTHILGGALAINIVPTVHAIQNTLGISVIT